MMAVARTFHSSLSRQPRPAAHVALYVDGARDPLMRPGVDVELSHWRNQSTPEPYRADTATGTALRFSDLQPDLGDLVVSAHVDVDGILAAYTLLFPDVAGVHGEALMQAAEIGDFWEWGNAEALAIFEGVTRLMQALLARGEDPNAIHAQCFELIHKLMGGLGRDDTATRAAVLALKEQGMSVERGTIQRRVPTPRMAHYVIPFSVVGDRLKEALHVPGFNAPLQDGCLLSPRVRAQWDKERVQLVSIEALGGFFHDLWYPGHAWALTPTLWCPPGLAPDANENQLNFFHPALAAAARELQDAEENPVLWTVSDRVFPFQMTARRGRKFPVVLSVLDGKGQPAPSSLHPQRVGLTLAQVFP